jgi:maltose alpha-D-glucosyltransferase / alpha-amylase
MFLRNHDELTLEMVTDSERDYLWSTYASDPRARINLGIRRRLAPLMENDRRKIELMKSLLFSLPGTPIIYYGDEIGMGDNIYLGDRNGVRTPMQWTPDRNGGFSRADPAKLYLPPIMDPVYGYQAVNVEAQSRSLSSFLSWMKRIIAVRKTSRVFGRGSMAFIRPANRAVLVYLRQYEDEVLLCVANLSRSAQAAEIDLSPWRGRMPYEMLGRMRFPRIGEAPYVITLAPYGFFWFQLRDETDSAGEIRSVPPEFVTLVMGHDPHRLFEGRTRASLERDVLPPFLGARRWFGEKGSPLHGTTLHAEIPLESGDAGCRLAVLDVVTGRGQARYAVPLAVKWSRFDKIAASPASILAAVRRYSREGTLVDVSSDPEFISLLLRKMHAGETIEADGRRIEFRPTRAFTEMPAPTFEGVKAVEREQSNTTTIVDNKFVVKVLRRVQAGVHPEIEMGRFLTDIAHYPQAPPLLGSLELTVDDTCTALAVVHGFVENQGDAWTVTSAYLDRFVDEQRVLADGATGAGSDLTSYLHRMRQIGRRTAELQNALASRPDIPDFAPEPVAPEDVRGWAESLADRASAALAELAHRRRELDDSTGALVDVLVPRREEILARIRAQLPADIAAVKIRQHGDFHLGQVLIVKDDACILDFEGEPQRSLEERRRKVPAARDVAGLLRSIDYAAGTAFERARQAWPDDHAKFLAALDDWIGQSSEAYLTAYRETLGSPLLWPADPAAAARLLDFFLMEKCFYEISYELANRPNWLRVPLMGLQRILTGKAVP